MIVANLKSTLATVIEGMFSFKRIYVGYILIALTCSVVYALSTVYPKLSLFLSASKATPWGIFTSIFAHANLTHLLLNMGSLLIFLMMFTFCNCTLSAEYRKKIERYFFVFAFSFAMITNLMWIMCMPHGTIGASGMVYVVMGAVISFSIINTFQVVNVFRRKPHRRPSIILVVDVLMILFIVANAMQDPKLLLDLGKAVNLVPHVASFLFGLLAVLPWYPMSQNYQPWNNSLLATAKHSLDS